MAITYVGGQVGGRAGATSTSAVTYALTGGSNSTPQAGDLVIITVVVASQARTPACAITTPATWTALTQINANGTTYDTSLNVSSKFMGGTPDTTFTLPSTGNVADAQRWTVQVWRGVDTGTPLDVAAVSASGTATGRPDPASITPTTSGAYVLICGGGAAATGAAYTAPANYTTGFLTGATVDTNDAMVGSGYRAWTSGAEDPAAYTGGTTNAVDSWAAYTIALRPTAPVTHDTSGAIVGSGSTIAGSAERIGEQPIHISSVALALGTSATPGAQAITVPSDAQIVVVNHHLWINDGSALSLSSSFAGTFTILQDSALSESGGVSYAVVSSIGSQTITPTWSNAPSEGPIFTVSFFKNVNTSDFVRDTDLQVLDSSGSAATITLTTTADDFVLALDSQYDSGQAIPANPSGWTSLVTSGINGDGARLRSADSPGASTTTVTGQSTSFSAVTGIAIKPAATGPVTHDTSGAIVGSGATISGTASHIAVHGSTGYLVGQGATVSGSANRFRAHDSAGAVVGQGTTVTGAANRFKAHDSTGAVVGQGATVAGTASRSLSAVTHTSTGAVVGQGSTVTGAANRFRSHTATGAVVGAGAVITGIAAHNYLHTATGALVGPGATVAGTANRFRYHDSTGAVVGSGATVTGDAARSNGPVTHTATGALVGGAANVAGAANRFKAHDATGAIVGSGATVTGSASRSNGLVTHTATGAVVGQGAIIAGVSARYRQHDSTGAVIGSGAVLTGSARHNIPHATAGDLVGQVAAVSGSAARAAGAVTHLTTGTLVGQGAAITGSATRQAPASVHECSGALIGQAGALSGIAHRNLAGQITVAAARQSRLFAGFRPPTASAARNTGLVANARTTTTAASRRTTLHEALP